MEEDGQHREQLAQIGVGRSREFNWRKTATRTVEVFEAAVNGSCSRLGKETMA
jgi:hypothetical protein